MKIRRFLPMAAGLLIALAPLNASAQTLIGDDLMETYYEAPEELREEFESSGWDMEIASSNYLNRTYGSGEGDVAGVTVYGIKTIYLSDNDEYADLALNHEMGHYFEYAYATYFGIVLSETNEFYYIYQNEAALSDLFSDYTISTSSEYFAEAYKWYCEDPSSLAYLYPNTYAYINEAQAEFETAVNSGEEPEYIISSDSMPNEPVVGDAWTEMGTMPEMGSYPEMGTMPETGTYPEIGTMPEMESYPEMGMWSETDMGPMAQQGMGENMWPTKETWSQNQSGPSMRPEMNNGQFGFGMMNERSFNQR